MHIYLYLIHSLYIQFSYLISHIITITIFVSIHCFSLPCFVCFLFYDIPAIAVMTKFGAEMTGQASPVIFLF